MSRLPTHIFTFYTQKTPATFIITPVLLIGLVFIRRKTFKKKLYKIHTFFYEKLRQIYIYSKDFVFDIKVLRSTPYIYWYNINYRLDHKEPDFFHALCCILLQREHYTGITVFVMEQPLFIHTVIQWTCTLSNDREIWNWL